MDFEIDVSGSDIFEKDYTIMAAERGNDKVMLGYKFIDRTIETLRSRHANGQYRYPNSKEGKSNLKIRLYCVSIYYLFKELQRRYRVKNANLTICRDFPGNEVAIIQQLKHFLGSKLGIETSIVFAKLPKGSVADNYAFLVRHDTRNKLGRYRIEIELGEFEIFLK